MDEIIENLYITDRIVARNLPEDDYEVIFLSLNHLNREHVHVPIDDAVPWPCETVKLVVDTISRWLHKGKRVCVACDAGISRSAGAVTAYLVCKRGMTIDEAVEFINSKRPITRPHPLIVESIIRCLPQMKD